MVGLADHKGIRLIVETHTGGPPPLSRHHRAGLCTNDRPRGADFPAVQTKCLLASLRAVVQRCLVWASACAESTSGRLGSCVVLRCGAGAEPDNCSSRWCNGLPLPTPWFHGVPMQAVPAILGSLRRHRDICDRYQVRHEIVSDLILVSAEQKLMVRNVHSSARVLTSRENCVVI